LLSIYTLAAWVNLLLAEQAVTSEVKQPTFKVRLLGLLTVRYYSWAKLTL